MIEDGVDKSSSIILSIDKNEIKFGIEYVKYRISEDNKLIILDLQKLPSDDGEVNIYLRVQYMPFYTDDESYDEDSDLNNPNRNTLELGLSFVKIDDEIKNISEAYMKMDLSEEECSSALQKEYAIMTSATYSNFAIEEYQMHLKILALLSPNSEVVIDLQSFSIRSGAWLKHTLNFALPPSLSYLFTVHSVYDDDKEQHEYWFHTHGLNRLGLPEVEIMNVHDDDIAYTLSNLISVVAKFTIENGISESLLDGKIELIYDIPTKFLLFAELENYFDKNILGMSDRDNESDMHSSDSITIVALEGEEDKKDVNDNNNNVSDENNDNDENGRKDEKAEKIVPFEKYKDKLGDNAIFSLSNFETMLMKEAARTTVGHFLDILEQHNNNDDFSFIVKLRYDDLQSGEAEHLWFEVHAFDKEDFTFDATLMNSPYYNIGLVEGQRGNYELSRLTDWAIHVESCDYSYNSSNIYMLFGDE